jgi:hypothetical protein
MAKRKYRRSAATSARPYARSGAKGRRPGSSILVVTEGVNTEPAYFEFVRRMFSSATVKLVSRGAGRGDPKSLTDFALKVQNERRRQARKEELNIHELEDFDEIWIVFDTDALDASKRSDGIAYARSMGVRIAYSEPCFEYWLLLHGASAYTTAPMAKCADVEPHLEKAFGWDGYSKSSRDCEKLIGPLVSKEAIRTAVAGAERCRNHHQGAGTAFPANPSTDVDQLIRAIDEAVPKANKLL